MDTMKNRIILAVVIALLAIGAGAGWYFTRPAPVVETAAPAVTQSDGSIELARTPDAKAKPKQIIPKGMKVERIEQVQVQGAGLKQPDGTTKAWPPVTVDMTLVRDAAGAQRVIASSPDGQVVGGVDIPVDTAAAPPEPPKWAVGVSMNPTRQTLGVWMERDLSRIRVGAELLQRDVGPLGGIEARVRVGWTF